jgi:Bacterial lectin
MRRVAGLLPAVLLAGVLTPVATGTANAASRGVIAPSGPLLYGQTFAGSVISPGTWIAGGGAHSGTPCLTARFSADPSSIPTCGKSAEVAGDATGGGVLRLTTNQKRQSGFALYTKPVNASAGLNISFDMYQFHTTTKRGGADGIGFVLIDGAQSPAAAGDAGGSLGYRGLTGALLGVGFDEWGNFANRALWGSGPDHLMPDSIVVRGAGSAGYPYLTGVRTPQLARDRTANRNTARRHVVIKISTSGEMTISVNFGHGLVREIRNLNLDTVPGQPPLPPAVKFGFTAATGAETDVHEISNLVISQLRPDLHTVVKPAGRFQAGGTGNLTATVSADPSGGPTTGTVTARIIVPGDLTPTEAEGNGWSCALGSQVVNCTRNDVLVPGGSLPPISVTTSVASHAPRKLTVRAAASTPGIFLSRGNSSKASVPIAPAPPGPDLAVRITPAAPLVAGRTGEIRLEVSDAPEAGPTRGAVTLRYDAPADSTVVAASGTGWTCAVQPAGATCTRPDALSPGKSFPPVSVTTAICHQADCTLKGAKATAGTPGSAQATATANLPVTRHSSLGLSLSTNPATPVPGYDTTFTAVVTNGGPTDVANAELVVGVPHGFSGQWTCEATKDSGCPGTLPSGALKTKLYVAAGGTVTLTATGQAGGAAAGEPVSATLEPPGSYADLYCSSAAPCTATGDATAGDAAR